MSHEDIGITTGSHRKVRIPYWNKPIPEIWAGLSKVARMDEYFSSFYSLSLLTDYFNPRLFPTVV